MALRKSRKIYLLLPCPASPWQVLGAEKEENLEEPVASKGHPDVDPKKQESAKMAWVARANHVPLDTCLQAKELFLEQVNALEKTLNLEQILGVWQVR